MQQRLFLGENNRKTMQQRLFLGEKSITVQLQRVQWFLSIGKKKVINLVHCKKNIVGLT